MKTIGWLLAMAMILSLEATDRARDAFRRRARWIRAVAAACLCAVAGGALAAPDVPYPVPYELPAATAEVRVEDRAGLLAAFNSAAPGTRIVVAPRDYGHVWLKRQTREPAVQIVGEDGARVGSILFQFVTGVVFHNIEFGFVDINSESGYLTFEGCRIAREDVGGPGVIHANTDLGNIQFLNCLFDGPWTPGDPMASSNTALKTGSNRLLGDGWKIGGCIVRGWGRDGMSFTRTADPERNRPKDCRIWNNAFYDIQDDCIELDGTAWDGLVVEGNVFARAIAGVSAAPTYAGPITIRGNTFVDLLLWDKNVEGYTGLPLKLNVAVNGGTQNLLFTGNTIVQRGAYAAQYWPSAAARAVGVEYVGNRILSGGMIYVGEAGLKDLTQAELLLDRNRMWSTGEVTGWFARFYAPDGNSRYVRTLEELREAHGGLYEPGGVLAPELAGLVCEQLEGYPAGVGRWVLSEAQQNDPDSALPLFSTWRVGRDAETGLPGMLDRVAAGEKIMPLIQHPVDSWVEVPAGFDRLTSMGLPFSLRINNARVHVASPVTTETVVTAGVKLGRATAELEALYPEPPLVIMLDNNESGPELTAGQMRLLHETWNAELSEGWRDVTRHVGYGEGMVHHEYGRGGANLEPDPREAGWDGGSQQALYIHSWRPNEDDTIAGGPQFFAMNVSWGKRLMGEGWWQELGAWDGKGISPERYEGYNQFGLWAARPRVLREFRSSTQLFSEFEAHTRALHRVVRRVHEDARLARFWREGENIISPHPNVLYRHVEAADHPLREWRDLLLVCPSHNPPIGVTGTNHAGSRTWKMVANDGGPDQVAVFALGLRIGEEYLVYAHAPLGPLADVVVEVPGLGEVTLGSVPPEGEFWFFGDAPEPTPTPTPEPTPTPTPMLVDLNTATLGELDALPGIGAVLTLRIVEGRPYGSVDDLAGVSGIGPATMAALRPLVTVGERPWTRYEMRTPDGVQEIELREIE